MAAALLKTGARHSPEGRYRKTERDHGVLSGNTTAIFVRFAANRRYFKLSSALLFDPKFVFSLFLSFKDVFISYDR